VRRPCHSGGEQNVQERSRGNRVEHNPQARLVLVLGHQLQQLMEREQHQAKPD